MGMLILLLLHLFVLKMAVVLLNGIYLRSFFVSSNILGFSYFVLLIWIWRFSRNVALIYLFSYRVFSWVFSNFVFLNWFLGLKLWVLWIFLRIWVKSGWLFEQIMLPTITENRGGWMGWRWIINGRYQDQQMKKENEGNLDRMGVIHPNFSLHTFVLFFLRFSILLQTNLNTQIARSEQ